MSTTAAPTSPMRMLALHHALALAREHVHEAGGNNRGAEVERIIRYAGGVVGEPWCVDTVIYVYGHAGSHVMRPGAPRAVRFMAPRAGVTVHGPREGRPGDPLRFIFDHTGLLVGYRRLTRAGRYVPASPATATHVMTVEGNTGHDGARADGSPTGRDGVFVRYRAIELVRDSLRVAR